MTTKQNMLSLLYWQVPVQERLGPACVILVVIIWASTRENLPSWKCEQHQFSS